MRFNKMKNKPLNKKNINPYDLNEIGKHFRLKIKLIPTRPLNDIQNPYDTAVNYYTLKDNK